ncbi:MAG: hypothetical protein ACLPYS_20375 [Vulcanimicrobiaceae bacterium]
MRPQLLNRWPDFIVGVGYKWLLGPFGLGYLYVAPEHRDGEPLEENWILRLGAEDFARLVDYQDSYQPGARRFDMGERSAFELTPAAIVCLEQLLEWGVSSIAVTLGAITARIETEVRALGIEPLAATDRGPHMLGIDLPADLREVAPAILRQHGVYVGMRGDSLRVSPHLYTTGSDIDRLMEALHRVLLHGNE